MAIMTKVYGGYICRTCGVSTSIKGHLCNPVELPSRTACRYTRNGKDNPEELCESIATGVRYVCESCSRMSTDKDFLCYPKRIPKAAKKPKGRKVSGVESSQTTGD